MEEAVSRGIFTDCNPRAEKLRIRIYALIIGYEKEPADLYGDAHIKFLVRR